MKNLVFKYLACFLITAAMAVALRAVFMAVYSGLYAGCGAAGLAAALWHGLPIDLCVAGYVTAIPALLLVGQALSAARWLRLAEKAYFILISLVLGLIAAADMALYGYWGFKLDMTPVFYFMSSPSAVVGGLSAAQAVGGAAAWLAVAAAYCLAYYYGVVRVRAQAQKHGRWLRAGAMLLLAALLFLPIRGGFGVSTMNPSKAYFSQNSRLNHAAMNPAFSLLYSAMHPAGGKGLPSCTPEEMAAALPLLIDRTVPAGVDTASLACERPDVYIIILESFSSHLLPSQGGEPIAVNLDSIAASGLLLTNAYACSFRTDRALPSILSAYAGIPATSIMKYVDKLERLPSLPRTLRDNGYDLSYYYGGDINFTNMQAYLVSSGFQNIVRDADFPRHERQGKWGAHDDALMRRALSDIEGRAPASKPQLTVIQTSSSHEPFEVPFRSAWSEVSPAANAFAYADSVLGDFMRHLAASPAWGRALVAIVPDHYGAYPEGLEGLRERHRIPIVFTGGALKRRGAVDVPASQADVAATMLAMLGIDHSEFALSHDALSAEAPHMAYFARPEAAGLITESGYARLNAVTGEIETVEGSDSTALMLKAMADMLYEPYK